MPITGRPNSEVFSKTLAWCRLHGPYIIKTNFTKFPPSFMQPCASEKERRIVTPLHAHCAQCRITALRGPIYKTEISCWSNYAYRIKYSKPSITQSSCQNKKTACLCIVHLFYKSQEVAHTIDYVADKTLRQTWQTCRIRVRTWVQFWRTRTWTCFLRTRTWTRTPTRTFEMPSPLSSHTQTDDGNGLFQNYGLTFLLTEYHWQRI